MSKSKKRERLNRQQNLLTLFPSDSNFYQERKIENDWFIKSWNGGTKRWQVGKYTQESYQRYKNYQNKMKLDKSFELALQNNN